jgi:hypothetical protein
MKLKLFLWGTFCLLASISNAQYTLQGKIVDEATGNPIDAVTIGKVGSLRTTISNERGEFVLKIDTLPATIGVHHISYESQRISTDTTAIVIKLKQSKIILNAVTVTPLSAKQILTKAWDKAEETIGLYSYGKGFYRQSTAVNDTTQEIYELFYNLKWDVNRINGWQALQARYAKSNPREIPINNQSYLCFLFSGYLFEFYGARYPQAKNIKRLYDVKLDRLITQSDETIAVITCTLKEKKVRSSWVNVNTTYYIGLSNYNVYKAESKVYNIPYVYSTGLFDSRTASDKYYSANFTATALFGEAKDFPTTILKSLETKLNLDYSKKDSTRRIQVRSLLNVYQEDQSLEEQVFRKTNEFVVDYKTVKNTAYNPEFWRDNEVVKRTPVENEFIGLMENKNAFGTMIDKPEPKTEPVAGTKQ